jgi:hypothetical protein
LQAAAGGALLPWLTYRVTGRAFAVAGEGAVRLAIIAASWSAAYGYFIYYAAALMTETFYIAGILWTLDISLRLAGDPLPGRPAPPRPASWRLWAELGLALAITSLLRQVFLVFIPFLVLWLAWRLAQGPGRLPVAAFARGVLAALALVAACIAPITLFNYRRFGRPVLLNTNAGFAFFWANHPVYGDRFQALLDPALGTYQGLVPEELRGLNEAELDSALLGRGLAFVAADPARYLRLSLSRVPVYFQFWPSADSSGPSNLVRTASFGLALPFMLLGTALWLLGALRGGQPGGLGAPAGLLLLFALVYSGVHLLSWALIRYRLPVDAVMLVFAANGLAYAAYGRRQIAYRLPQAAVLRTPASISEHAGRGKR